MQGTAFDENGRTSIVPSVHVEGTAEAASHHRLVRSLLPALGAHEPGRGSSRLRAITRLAGAGRCRWTARNNGPLPGGNAVDHGQLRIHFRDRHHSTPLNPWTWTWTWTTLAHCLDHRNMLHSNNSPH